MEFKEEFIKTNELNEAQVTALTKATNDNEATLKQEWDGKANENAEAILHGATKSVQDLTGITHEKGQKIAEYLTLASSNYLEGSKSSLERKQKELDEKIKNAGGDETLKTELQEAKDKITGLQKIEAEHSELVKGDYKNLFEKANTELSTTKQQVAFGNVKPKFADGVNEYEAKAKWNEFKSGILEKYEIHLDENHEAIAVDKENKFKTSKLSDLVKENQEIQELVKGRQQTGAGSGQKKTIEIEDVPFAVPEGADSKERTKVIRDYITGVLKLSITSPDYPKKFSEFNKKILEKTPA